jgi:hypothetical protein
MTYDDISEFSFESSVGKIMVRIMKFENGLLLLVTDSDTFRLGLSAVAIPSGSGRAGPTSSGLLSLSPDASLVRTIAERVSAWTNQMCMMIIGVKDLTRELTLEITTSLRNHLQSEGTR